MSELLQRLQQLSRGQRATLLNRLKGQTSTAAVYTRLIAYVVPTTGQSLDVASLRTALASRLPDYMLPAQIVQLTAMPLTPNGKLDRLALPEPNEIIPAPESGFIEPRTETELEIARIWAALLGFDMIGIHDNFFELGGHSLLVTQAIARLRDRFQVELGVTAFFERPTIAQLAAYIGSHQPSGERDELEF